jgi:hypothetical protein
MRPQEIDLDVADASLTGFASNVTGATFILTATAPTDGLAHQVSIRNDSITDSGKTVTLVGTDANDRPQTEVVTAPGTSATVESTLYFKTLTSATPSATIGADTFDIGWVDEISSGLKLLNWRSETAAMVAVDVTGTLQFTVQETFDHPLQTTEQIQAAKFYDVTALAAKTADTRAQISIGATGMRVLVDSYSSGAELQANIVQPSAMGV